MTSTYKCDLCWSMEDRDHMVCCKRCQMAMHIYCLEPMLDLPVNPWFCGPCSRKRKQFTPTPGPSASGGSQKRVKQEVSAPNGYDAVRAGVNGGGDNIPQGVPLHAGIGVSYQGVVGRADIATVHGVKKREQRRGSGCSTSAGPPATKQEGSSALISPKQSTRRLEGKHPPRRRSAAVPVASPPRNKVSRRGRTVQRVNYAAIQGANWGHMTSNQEEKLLQQAIKNSRVSQFKMDVGELPLAPVFRPTAREFSDPIRYIRSLHQVGEKWGVVKVVPPKEWSPGFHIDMPSFRFATRKQHVHKLQEAKGFDNGADYNLSDYKEMADKFAAGENKLGRLTVDEIERRYWQIVTKGSPEVVVEYGNDVDSAEAGSGFGVPDFSEDQNPGMDGWNLNHIAVLRNSPLRHLRKSVQGVTVPWVYCGMMYSSFCWHCEDNHLPSINYCHIGSPKVWYAVAAHHSKALERVMKNNMPLLFRKEPDLMQKLVTMLDPATLIANGVPVCRAVQTQGSFIITFPRGYHCGFNTGFNVAEAVNFSYDEWFPYGRLCTKRYRELGRTSVFPHDWLLMAHVRGGATGPLLDEEMAVIFEEESRLRKKAMKAGIQRVEYMSDTDGPECKTCKMCHHHCYLSFMTCFCPNQSQVVCLNHLRYLCACQPSNKIMYVRPVDPNSPTTQQTQKHHGTERKQLRG